MWRAALARLLDDALGLLIGLAIAKAGGLGCQVAGVAFSRVRKIFRTLCVLVYAETITKLHLNRLTNSNALRVSKVLTELVFSLTR